MSEVSPARENQELTPRELQARFLQVRENIKPALQSLDEYTKDHPGLSDELATFMTKRLIGALEYRIGRMDAHPEDLGNVATHLSLGLRELALITAPDILPNQVEVSNNLGEVFGFLGEVERLSGSLADDEEKYQFERAVGRKYFSGGVLHELVKAVGDACRSLEEEKRNQTVRTSKTADGSAQEGTTMPLSTEAKVGQETPKTWQRFKDLLISIISPTWKL